MTTPLERFEIVVISNSTIEHTGIGGGLKRIVEICKRWVSKGLTVKFVGSDEDFLVCRNQGLQDITFQRLPSFSRLKFCVPLVYVLRTLMSCIEIIKSIHFERAVFYSASDFWPDVIPSLLMHARSRNSKLISIIHLIAPNPFSGQTAEEARKNKSYLRYFPKAVLYWVSQCLAIKLLFPADLVLCVNEEMKEYLVSRGIERNKIKVILNGVDLTSIRKTPKNTECFDACFVGRFHLQKGVLDLPPIWELVCKVLPQARLAIIGGGDQVIKKKLCKAIKDKNLQHNMSVLGPLPEDQKNSIMKSAKLLLFPSYYESFGIVVIECLACGLPVIAYDLPCLSKFKSLVTRVPIGDVNRFSQAIIECITDESSRKEHEGNALRFVKTYDWDHIAASELSLVADLLGHPT